MAAGTAPAPQQQRPPFSLNQFLQLTQPSIQRVGATQPYVDGGRTTFILPQSGLLSEIMVNISGTITVAGTVTGGTWQGWPYPAPWGLVNNVSLTSNQNLQLLSLSGWGWYKRSRRRYARDPIATNAGSYASSVNTSLGIGAPAIVQGAAITAATYAVNITLPIPIAYNRELMAGLLVLQNSSIQYPLQFTWGTVTGGISATGGTNALINGLTGTGLSVTSALNCTVDCEIMAIPRNYPPDVSMFLSCQETVYPNQVTVGQNVVRPAPNDLYTMFQMEVVANGVPLPPSAIQNAAFVFSGNLRRYDEDYNTKLGWDYWHTGIQSTIGEIVYDMGIRRGDPHRRDLYDAFNDTLVTDLQLQFNIANGTTVTGVNQVSLISESLRYVQQR